ncbi:ribosome small subunit-dependent GTPase A [Anaeropeptidivorans aminofermentans]|uniref:ribosome small subunit-dependent GTPase A n=1 Tax=Anaeropeptidivorans aminofermentans TaxID=2934315 RepID=UPI002023BF1D|nr:ribosome small subunit-dependent GTPase A [Anaeropeptidivorans aminofermentans]
MVKGRIIKGVGGLYEVDADGIIYNCRARGVFRKEGLTPLVGDLVDIDIIENEDNTGTIYHIYERSSELIRPRASNVTQVVLVFAVKRPNINLDLMDRFIISCERQKVNILICFNKTDVLKEKDLEGLDHLNKIYKDAGFEVFNTSVVDYSGIEKLKERLKNNISIFAGPSGAGKSSLINILAPHADMETGGLSPKISRGRHTTRHTELIKGPEEIYIMDSPGFTSLYLDNLENSDLELYFREFAPFIKKCRFTDCSHIAEPECAVAEAVEKGIISEERYNRYKLIYNEMESGKYNK